MRVFLNPGHSPNGIPDSGTWNPESGIRECDVALNVSKRVKKYLEDVGYEVKMVQSDSLWDICNASNAWGADLFVSIHCNASAGRNARGTESWYWYGSNAGRILATCMNSEILSCVSGLWNRGAKDGNFYVLRNTDAPAVLVETAFLDNNDDEFLLVTCEDEFARGIARGITDYFGIH